MTTTSAPTTPKPRRRWLQYSLRTLLVLIVLFGVGLIPLAYTVKIGQLRAIDRDVSQRIRLANSLSVRFHGLGAPPSGHLFVIKDKRVIAELADSFRAIESHKAREPAFGCGFLLAVASGPDHIVSIIGDSSSVFYSSPSDRDSAMVVSIDPEFSFVLRRYFGVESLWKVAEDPASVRTGP